MGIEVNDGDGLLIKFGDQLIKPIEVDSEFSDRDPRLDPGYNRDSEVCDQVNGDLIAVIDEEDAFSDAEDTRVFSLDTVLGPAADELDEVTQEILEMIDDPIGSDLLGDFDGDELEEIGPLYAMIYRFISPGTSVPEYLANFHEVEAEDLEDFSERLFAKESCCPNSTFMLKCRQFCELTDSVEEFFFESKECSDSDFDDPYDGHDFDGLRTVILNRDKYSNEQIAAARRLLAQIEEERVFNVADFGNDLKVIKGVVPNKDYKLCLWLVQRDVSTHYRKEANIKECEEVRKICADNLREISEPKGPIFNSF